MSLHTRRTFLKVSGGVLGGIAAGTTVTAATSADRFIVRTRGQEPPGDLDVVHEMPGVNYAVVRGSEAAVRSSKRVRDYAPDIELELHEPSVNAVAPTVEEATPTDEPYYALQWDKQALDVPTAHETTTGEGTRVTIIDTGVAAGHPDLDVNESLSRNFTGDGFGAGIPAGGYHGTHVGGIVAAQDNGEGVIGTAPSTDLVDCRVFSPGSLASFADILAAIVYSTNIDADAANLSLGAYPIPRQGLGQFYGKVLNRVMTYANSEGTLLCIAAGNDAADLQHDKNLISLPNESAQALSISATGPVGFGWDASNWGGGAPPESPAFYTNYGTNAVDIGAPGGDASLAVLEERADEDDDPFPALWYLDLVLSTIAQPEFRYEDVDDDDEEEPVEYLGATYSYGWAAGTSMASPQVAGAAALVKSVNSGYNANQVESALERAASVPAGYDKAYYGSGFLNINDAL